MESGPTPEGTVLLASILKNCSYPFPQGAVLMERKARFKEAGNVGCLHIMSFTCSKVVGLVSSQYFTGPVFTDVAKSSAGCRAGRAQRALRRGPHVGCQKHSRTTKIRAPFPAQSLRALFLLTPSLLPAGRRAGGAQGALRRGSQRRLRAEAGGRGLQRGVWSCGPQDALQMHHGRAPGKARPTLSALHQIPVGKDFA